MSTVRQALTGPARAVAMMNAGDEMPVRVAPEADNRRTTALALVGGIGAAVFVNNEPYFMQAAGRIGAQAGATLVIRPRPLVRTILSAAGVDAGDVLNTTHVATVVSEVGVTSTPIPMEDIRGLLSRNLAPHLSPTGSSLGPKGALTAAALGSASLATGLIGAGYRLAGSQTSQAKRAGVAVVVLGIHANYVKGVLDTLPITSTVEAMEVLATFPAGDSPFALAITGMAENYGVSLTAARGFLVAHAVVHPVVGPLGGFFQGRSLPSSQVNHTVIAQHLLLQDATERLDALTQLLGQKDAKTLEAELDLLPSGLQLTTLTTALSRVQVPKALLREAAADVYNLTERPWSGHLATAGRTAGDAIPVANALVHNGDLSAWVKPMVGGVASVARGFQAVQSTWDAYSMVREGDLRSAALFAGAATFDAVATGLTIAELWSQNDGPTEPHEVYLGRFAWMATAASTTASALRWMGGSSRHARVTEELAEEASCLDAGRVSFV